MSDKRKPWSGASLLHIFDWFLGIHDGRFVFNRNIRVGKIFLFDRLVFFVGGQNLLGVILLLSNAPPPNHESKRCNQEHGANHNSSKSTVLGPAEAVEVVDIFVNEVEPEVNKPPFVGATPVVQSTI